MIRMLMVQYCLLGVDNCYRLITEQAQNKIRIALFHFRFITRYYIHMPIVCRHLRNKLDHGIVEAAAIALHFWAAMNHLPWFIGRC